MEVPFKIKIFMWFLKYGVILTKDSLSRRNCYGSTYCCFNSNMENIQHLFAKCYYDKFLVALHNVFGIYTPSLDMEKFGGWCKQGGKENMFLLQIGGNNCLMVYLALKKLCHV